MSVSGHRNPNLLANLRRVLREVSRDPKPKLVHQLRTTIRRTEALWQAHRLEASGKSRALAKQFAKLRRRAGKVRDLDVQLKLLSSVNIGGKSGAKKRLENALEDTRQSQEKKLLGELDGKGLKKLLKRTANLHEGASAGKIAASASAQIARSLKKLKVIGRKSTPFTLEQLHDFRIRCKKIRYTSELLPPTPDVAALITKLKTMQDAVGEWHDWLNLAHTAEDELPSSERALLSAIKNIANAKFAEALRICRRTLQEISFTPKAMAAEAAQKPFSQKKAAQRALPPDSRAAAHTAASA